MKICVIGNSAGFKIRPPRTTPDERTYSEILEAAGHCVKNVSKAGVILREAYGMLDDEVLTFFPDAVVINHGVVEVCYRRNFRLTNNSAIPNVYLNSIFRRRYEFAEGAAFKAINFVRRAINWGIKTTAKTLGIKWQWMRKEAFMEVMKATCELIQKETNARIFIVGITPCSPRVERILKGSGEEIAATNRLLREYCAGAGPRVRFVDVERFVTEADFPEIAPDGVHFSAAGHKRVAEHLLRAIEGKEDKACLS